MNQHIHLCVLFHTWIIDESFTVRPASGLWGCQLSNHREVVMPSPMMYFIFGHAKDLRFKIFPQAQEQFSGVLIVQKFLPHNRLDLIQADQIEPSESLHRFQMCFNKAILFHYVILFIPSPHSFFGRHTWSQVTLAPVVLISEPDQRKDLIICSTFFITCPGKRKRDAQ
jgi:hypothetical protein